MTFHGACWGKWLILVRLGVCKDASRGPMGVSMVKRRAHRVMTCSTPCSRKAHAVCLISYCTPSHDPTRHTLRSASLGSAYDGELWRQPEGRMC